MCCFLNMKKCKRYVTVFSNLDSLGQSIAYTKPLAWTKNRATKISNGIISMGNHMGASIIKD